MAELHHQLLPHPDETGVFTTIGTVTRISYRHTFETKMMLFPGEQPRVAPVMEDTAYDLPMYSISILSAPVYSEKVGLIHSIVLSKPYHPARVVV